MPFKFDTVSSLSRSMSPTPLIVTVLLTTAWFAEPVRAGKPPIGHPIRYLSQELQAKFADCSIPASMTDIQAMANASEKEAVLAATVFGDSHYFAVESRKRHQYFDSLSRWTSERKTRLDQILKARSYYLTDLKQGNARTAFPKLLLLLQSAENVLGQESYLFGQLQYAVACQFHFNNETRRARTAASHYANAMSAFFGSKSMHHRDALLLQSLIEAADRQFLEAWGYHEAAETISTRLTKSSKDLPTLAVASVISLREGKISQFQMLAKNLAAIMKEHGEGEPVDGESSADLNNVLCVSETLSSNTYLSDSLVVLDDLIRQAESTNNTSTSAVAMKKYYGYQALLLYKLGRLKEAQASIKRSSAIQPK